MAQDPSVVLPSNGHVQVAPEPLSLGAQATRLDALRVAVTLAGTPAYAGEPTIAAVVAKFNTLQTLFDIGSQLDPDTATVSDIAAGLATLSTIGLAAA